MTGINLFLVPPSSHYNGKVRIRLSGQGRHTKKATLKDAVAVGGPAGYCILHSGPSFPKEG